MEKIFVVAFVAEECRVIEFASEDGEHYQAPTANWAHVAEPRRVVKDGEVLSAASGAKHGPLEEWLNIQGVYEYWTDCERVALALAKTVGFARTLGKSSRCYDGWNAPL